MLRCARLSAARLLRLEAGLFFVECVGAQDLKRVGYKIFGFALLLGAVLFAAAPEARADERACTDGSDCYCDRVVKSGNPSFDPSLIFCEDFEAATLHDDTHHGGGAPFYGPWYDDTGYPGGRGSHSYWTRTYGPAASDCAWRRNGQESSFKRGFQCNFDTCFAGEWSVGDPWNANSFACLDIVRDGEFAAEVADIQAPLAPGNHSGVFDGWQSLAHRTAPRRTGGITGEANWDKAYKTFGVTMALAYPTNSERANLWRAPWKHNEWRSVADGSEDGIFLFHNGSSLSEEDPFQMFMFHADGSTQAQCESALVRARVIRGKVWCNDVALYYRADPAYYQRSSDFRFGTWGCARGYFKNLGADNSLIQIWFNDQLIVHIENLDTRVFSAREGYKALIWNNYSNLNEEAANPSERSRETTYRYEDNIHIRAGAPVACSQIGFDTLVSAGGEQPILQVPVTSVENERPVLQNPPDVTPVANERPMLEVPGVREVVAGQTVKFVVRATDSDGDFVDVRIRDFSPDSPTARDAEILRYTNEDGLFEGTFQWRPSNEGADQMYSVVLIARDQRGAERSKTVLIAVDDGDNDGDEDDYDDHDYGHDDDDDD